MLWKDNTFRPYVYFKPVHTRAHTHTHTHTHTIQRECRRVDRRPNLQSILPMLLTESFRDLSACRSIKKCFIKQVVFVCETTSLNFFHNSEPLIKRHSDGIEEYCNHVLWHKPDKAWYLNGMTGIEGIAETLTCRWSVCLSVRLYKLLREGDNKCLCSPLEKDRHMQYYQKGGNVRGESGLEVH